MGQELKGSVDVVAGGRRPLRRGLNEFGDPRCVVVVDYQVDRSSSLLLELGMTLDDGLGYLGGPNGKRRAQAGPLLQTLPVRTRDPELVAKLLDGIVGPAPDQHPAQVCRALREVRSALGCVHGEDVELGKSRPDAGEPLWGDLQIQVPSWPLVVRD